MRRQFKPIVFIAALAFLCCTLPACKSAQHKAVNQLLFGATKRGRLTDVWYAVSQGANVDTRNQDGETALHLAAAGKHTEIVRLLVENGADPDAADKVQRRRPLSYAVINNDVDILTILLNHSAQVNYKEKSGRTPLMLADESKQPQVVRLLRDAGANE